MAKACMNVCVSERGGEGSWDSRCGRSEGGIVTKEVEERMCRMQWKGEEKRVKESKEPKTAKEGE